MPNFRCEYLKIIASLNSMDIVRKSDDLPKIVGIKDVLGGIHSR